MGDELNENTEQQQTQQEEKLIAGKFKSLEDLENAYKSAESKMHDATTKFSRAVEALKQLGAQVDDDGNIILPQGQTNTNPIQQTNVDPTRQDDWFEEINAKFYEDPARTTIQTTYGIVSTLLEQRKRAEANKKRELSKYKNHPLYSRIADDLDATLDQIPDAQLADPAQATVIVEKMFEMAAGRYALQMAQTASEDATKRAQLAKELGVEKPDVPNEDAQNIVGTEERNMLARLGLSDKDQEDVIKRAKRAAKE